MSGKSKLLLCTSLIAAAAITGPAFAASKKEPAAKAPTNVELLKRIEKLESDLQSQKDAAKSTKARVSTLEQNANDVSWSFDNGRPTIKTGDGRFTFSLRGRFQVDYADFGQRSIADVANKKKTDPRTLSDGKVPFDLGSGTLIRRAYLGFEGRAFKDFWYEFRANFGGGNGSENGDPLVNLARIAYVGIPHFRVNVGVIEPVFTMGSNVSSGQLLFLERPEATNIANGLFGAGDTRKGVELDFFKEGLLYGADNLVASAAFTGATTQNNNAAGEGHGNGGDENTQALAHVAYRVYSDSNTNIQFGGNYSHVFSRSGKGIGDFTFSDRPEVRVDGSSLVSASISRDIFRTADMWGLEGEAQWKNFYLGGEYQNYQVEERTSLTGLAPVDPRFSAYYVQASWILTGEHKTYSASAMNNEMGAFGMPKVVKPFSISGHSWGAWELVARYSVLDLNFNVGKSSTAGGRPGGYNPIAGGVQRGMTVGVNWYLNQNIRLMLDDTMIQVEKSTVKDDKGWLNNYGGQNLNIIAARAQFQF